MFKITSLENQIIKNVIKLYSSKDYRFETQKFVVEGVRLIRDTYTKNIPIEYLLVTEECFDKVCDINAENIVIITEQIAKKIADTKSPQGAFAICKGTLILDELPKGNLIILCSLQDPGNVGTILRTASAFDIGVVMTNDCPSLTSPKVLRAGMGCRKAYIAESLEEVIIKIKKSGRKVYAATLSENSKSILEINLNNAVVMIGNEGNGLKTEEIKFADESVIIPISKDCESLNAASAANIFLWELRG